MADKKPEKKSDRKKSDKKKKKKKEKALATRQEVFNWLNRKPGDAVINGTIGRIYYASPDYIIYSTKENPDELSYYENKEIMRQNLNLLLPALDRLRAYLSTPSDRAAYFPQIAGIYKLSFEGRVDEAMASIDALVRELRDRRNAYNTALLTYQGICFGTVLLVILVAVFLRYSDWSLRYADLWRYYKIMVWGSFGGWLSVSYNMNKYEYDLTVTRSIRVFSAASRIFIAMLSSIVVYSLIQSNTALGFLNSIDNKAAASRSVYYTLAVVSGFSESFVPDLLRVVEKKTLKDKE